MEDRQPKPSGPTAKGPDNPAFAPPARPARVKTRHVLLLLSFVIWVLVPTGGVAVYLYTVAKDQYASHVGFSVRKEEVGTAMELLGGISALSGSSSTDTDILYEFIRSRQMVRLVNDRLDLQSIYTMSGDPFFSLGTDTRIEALVDYWKRVVNVYYDNSSGLIEVRALAFRPKDARAITQIVFEEKADCQPRQT